MHHQTDLLKIKKLKQIKVIKIGHKPYKFK